MNFYGSVATIETEGDGIFAARLDALQEQLKERGEGDVAQVIAEAQRRLGNLQSEVDHLEFTIDSYVASYADDESRAKEARRAFRANLTQEYTNGDVQAEHQWMERPGGFWPDGRRARIPAWQQCSWPGCGVSRAAAEHFRWVNCGGRGNGN